MYYNSYENSDYTERLDEAIDALRDILNETDGDFDIHDITMDLSIDYDVEKSDLLDWYDNQ